MIAVDAISDSGQITVVSQAVTFAVVGGFFTLLTLMLTNRAKAQTEQRLADAIIAKEERDYARQDLVEERRRCEQEIQRKQLDTVERLGKVTHALVNSDKTAAMRTQRDAMITTLILMEELVRLKGETGNDPTQAEMNAIDSMRERVKSLGHEIDERLAQQKLAERENGLEHAG